MTQGIQSFSTAADDCIGDWVALPGRNLSVEVLVYPDWEVVAGRSIAVEVACEVFESCVNYRFEYPGDALKIEFICCALPCTNEWQDLSADNLVLDATDDWTDDDGGSLILDVPACDSSCPGTWYPQPGNALDIEFVCCGATSGADIILTGLEAYDGQTFNFDFTSDKRFVLDYSEGQTLSAVLTAPQSITLAATFDTGESLVPTLRTTVVFAPDFYTGEEFRFLSLNTYPTIMMSADGYEGQTLTGTLSASAVASVTFQIGESIIADLNTRPAELLSIPVLTGETFELSIVTHRLIATTFVGGEYAVADLLTEPYEGIMSVLEIGETLSATLDTIPGFIIRVYNGETLTGELATSVAIPITAYAGETLTVAMYQAQYWNPEPTAYAGETLSPSLSVGTFSFGVMIGEVGEEFRFDLKTNDKPALVANGSTGETASVSISWAANIGDMKFYHGTTAVVDTLEFDSLYRVYEGATAEVGFATEMTLPPVAYEGARLSIDLKTGPSEGMGRFTASHGEEMTVQTLALLKAVFLGVTFYNSYVFNVGAPYLGTFMDLDSGCCSNHFPGQQDYHIIEMNDAEFGDQRFDGDRIRATVDFQTQPRFRFNFTHGETLLAVEDNTFLMSPSMTTGATMTVSLESNHINFPLCPVNFIPDGDNVYAELDFVDTTECRADYAYAGESMTMRLRANQNFQEQYTHGETMNAELTLQSAWVLFAATGETARVSNPEVGANGQTGEVMAVSFYVEPIIGGHGETMYADLTTLYEVVFLEDGCLDNEYIWQDENGDPIPEKFNPVPVELDPYQHDIKARCQ